MLSLVRPTLSMKNAALAYRQAHFDAGEAVINGSELLDKSDCYEDWLARVTANADAATVDPHWVVTDTFFAVDDTDEIVGIIDLRRELKGFLVDFGNTGYSVRPDHRGKGYATEMLRQLLNVARAAGMAELHLSAERTNVASIRTIIKNGGVCERTFTLEGEPVDVYRITL